MLKTTTATGNTGNRTRNQILGNFVILQNCPKIQITIKASLIRKSSHELNKKLNVKPQGIDLHKQEIKE